MTAALITIGLVGLAFIIKSCASETSHYSDKSRPANAPTPTKKYNDKIVVIKGANYNDIKKAITQFCNLYNREDLAAVPNLTKISETEFVVTFPYDLTFDKFCFFVNYMYYPNEIFYKADIKAWATTKQGDIWITDKSVNKKVMLFIPPDDQEHDNVYLTTQDNIGYKLGFAQGEETKLLDKPKLDFVSQTKTVGDIAGHHTEDIK